MDFNSNDEYSEYVGYKYTSGSQYGLNTNSAIKTHLDSWYTSNLNSSSTVDTNGNKYDKYISRTAIYCNDRTVGVSYNWSSSVQNTFYYGAYTRLANSSPSPTYTCSQLNDRFTTSTTTGNGQLYNSSGVESPIATITADEVAFAGASGSSNKNYYLYQNASSTADYYWTMTPGSAIGNNSSSAMMWIVGVTEGAGAFGDGVITYFAYARPYYADNSAVRPVISLKSCVQWDEGNGTSASPYKVNISSSCTNKEN